MRAMLRTVCGVAVASVIAGCGGSVATSGSSTSAASQKASGAGDRAAVAVIRGWAQALRNGNIAAAARYFALPSVFANSFDAAGNPVAVRVTSEREARLVNESLSCGAALVSTTAQGRYITAIFKLTNRSGPGGGCAGGAGQPAATRFLIAHGRIVQWIRAPAVSTGGAAPQAPAPAANSTGPGVSI